MYLTKIELDRSYQRIRSAMGDSQQMHRLVTGLFGKSRKEADVLYRVRMSGILGELYLYSVIPVMEERVLPGMRLTAQRDVTLWLESMKTGDIYRFQLLTAPSKKVACEGTKHSRRRSLREPEERLTWLARKGEQGGFAILSVQETPGEKLSARHTVNDGGMLTVDSFCYTGCLRITDENAFRRTVREGIGPEKAYGLGMLLLAAT